MGTYREDLLKEVSNASKMLQKYEDKLLKEEELSEEKRDYFIERVRFWSEQYKELKSYLLKSQETVASNSASDSTGGERRFA